ncbi:DUF7919 family protein [Streptomyces goshikiensis]|uniref:DUF7919 family protein n=1 Tax=Streptomyces TaxID=1883 RepID=UPI00224D417D|nr:hypothetical protein [Streptomyces sp. NBC_01214]MCX4804690.1 hypothetical protein [Streptomyces sp. NBC_01214]
MTYYADLTPYTYDKDNWARDATGLWRGVPLTNVGWLDRGKPYEKGTAPPGLAEALKCLSRTHRAQQTRGFHPCPFCTSRVFGRRASHPQGSAEIWLMGGGVAYAAPELITHYVETHGYSPPTAFTTAVFAAL